MMNSTVTIPPPSGVSRPHLEIHLRTPNNMCDNICILRIPNSVCRLKNSMVHTLPTMVQIYSLSKGFIQWLLSNKNRGCEVKSNFTVGEHDSPFPSQVPGAHPQAGSHADKSRGPWYSNSTLLLWSSLKNCNPSGIVRKHQINPTKYPRALRSSSRPSRSSKSVPETITDKRSPEIMMTKCNVVSWDEILAKKKT